MTQARGLSAGLSASALLFAAVGAALGGWIARDGSIDARFVGVAFGAVLPLLALRIARPGSSRATRVVLVALGLPLLLALAWPRSPSAVSWLSGAVLFLGAEAGGHAARSAWRAHRRLGPPLAALVGVVALWLWLGTFVVLFNTQLLVAPVRLAHLRPTELDIERSIALRAEDGLTLGATYTPGIRGAPGVVLAHGVADGRTSMLALSGRLREEGYHVLRFDFRAHGTSEGAVCTYGQHEQADVRAAVEALRAIDGVDGERIAVIGASMGGGSVLAAASSLPPAVRAFVLLAPASSYPPLVEQRVRFLGPLATPVMVVSAAWAEAAGQIPMTRWIPAAHADPSGALRIQHGQARPCGADNAPSGRAGPRLGAPCSDPRPLLVFHGDADEAIPLELSRALVRERPHAELVVLRGVAHDSIPRAVPDDAAAWARARAFLAERLASDIPMRR